MSILFSILIPLWLGFTSIVLVVYAYRRQNSLQKIMQNSLLYTQLKTEENLRISHNEMELSLKERIIAPWFQRRQEQFQRRFLPRHIREDLQTRIELAGWAMTPEQFFTRRVIFAVVGILIGLFLGRYGALYEIQKWYHPFIPFIAMFLLGFLGWSHVRSNLDKAVKANMQEFENSLPEVFDLLSISVQAGLGFEAALHIVYQKSTGVVRRELEDVIRNMQLGKTRNEALRRLVQRTKLEDLRQFVTLAIQSEKSGAPISEALKIQARTIKDKKFYRSKEQAAKLPVKIIMPLIMFIFPVMFVVLMGPAALHILLEFHKIPKLPHISL